MTAEAPPSRHQEVPAPPRSPALAWASVGAPRASARRRLPACGRGRASYCPGRCSLVTTIAVVGTAIVVRIVVAAIVLRDHTGGARSGRAPCARCGHRGRRRCRGRLVVATGQGEDQTADAHELEKPIFHDLASWPSDWSTRRMSVGHCSQVVRLALPYGSLRAAVEVCADTRSGGCSVVSRRRAAHDAGFSLLSKAPTSPISGVSGRIS